MNSPRQRRLGKTLATMAVVSTVLSLVMATPASAAPPVTEATAIKVRIPPSVNVTLADVDCPPSPSSATTVGLSAAPVAVIGAGEADCDLGGATASVASTSLLGGTVELGVIQSECTRTPTGATGSSSVAVVSGLGALNGTIVTAPTTVNLFGGFQLRLNSQFTGGDGQLHVIAVDLAGPNVPLVGAVQISQAEVQCGGVVDSPTSSVELDDTVLGNGTRSRVSATLTCPAGEVFRLGVVLTQAGATGSGSTRGTCSGEPQPVSVGITTTSGPSFTAGDVEAEATLDTSDPGARTINDTTTATETLTYTLS